MNSGYHSRLGLMEDWYGDFLRSGDREEVLLRDFAPHAAYLRRLRGSVIDIGGGAGLPARFLSPDVDYTVVDPSQIWSSPEWAELGENFRQAGPRPRFIDAPGENLPFPDETFDSALSFWTLNHVREPGACVQETARVLRAGGSARFVLEDVEPSWADLLGDAVRRAAGRISGRRGTAGIHMRLRPAFFTKARGEWPLQHDHLRIRDEELRDWLGSAFHVQRRSWIAGCLTYDVVKR